MKKFIILSHQRSGSTLLTRSLNSHSLLRVEDEIFHPTWHSILKWRNENLGIKYEPISNLKNYEEFILDVFSNLDGFKVLNTNPVDIDKLIDVINKYNIFVIILKRKDLIKSIISAELCKITNVWQNEDFVTKQNKCEIHIQPEEIEIQINKINNFYIKLEKINNNMKILYEDLISDWDFTIEKILNKIEIQNELIPMKLGKLTEDYQISNYKEIVLYFKRKFLI